MLTSYTQPFCKVACVLLLGLGLVVLPSWAQAQGSKPVKGAALFGALRARHLGPAVMSGRIADLDVVNNDPKTMYVGAAAGGVWKTENGGVTFEPIFDKYNQSIGKITIDQKNPKTVWVGTGEPWVRNSTSVGNGIYKTTDGGKEWEFKGLPDSERISDIVIDPNNSDVVYVGVMGHLWNGNADRGVYKTTDGGATWNKVLFVDDNTGCADLAIDPANPNVLYASMWQFRRYPDFFYSGGKGSNLYKSTDGGATWNKITPSNINSEIGRISVDVFDAASEVLYATVEAKSKEDRGLYRSTDAGSNWERINGKEFGVNVRPFYFARTLIDPKNDSILYKVGLNLVVSKDQGRTFRAVGSGVHSDIHAVWVNPNNTEHVVIGTDGGVFVSFDRAYNFYMLKNLPVSQFYHVAVDDQTPYNVYGGLQDNGSWVGPSQSANGIENRDWVNVGGGDGFWVLPYPKDPNIIFCEYQGGNLMRHDRRTGQNKQVKPYTEPGQPKLRFNWNSPMHISATNPDRFYYGSQFLHVSYDKGDSWQTISPDLTTNDPQRQRQAQSGGVTIDNSSAENNTTIFTIAESPKDEKLIWVGTDDGNLQVSENGGGNWVNVVGNIPNLPKNTWCSKVEPSRFERNTIYATFDGHRAGDKKPYIYKSTDLGKTWVSLVTEDLKGFVHVIKEDLVNPNLLFAGTEFGLFISVDGGQNWAQFTNNMPAVPVNDVVIHPRENALLMATHGRGIVVVDDISALRQVTTEVLEKPIHIFEMPPVVLRGNASFQEYGGGGEFVGENPKEVALITYYLKKRHTFGDLDVEVYNEKGELLKKMPGGKSAGINMVEWATRLKGAKAAPTNNTQAIGGSIAGVSLPEGKYTVKIKKDEEIFTGTIELVADPNSVHSADDRRVQSEAAMQLYNMTEQVAYLYYTADDIQKQAEKAAEAGGKAAKDLNALAKTLKDYKNSLVDAEGDGYIDTKERIREEISELYGAINGYAGKPSQSQLDKLAGLAQDLGVKQNEFEKIKNGDLAKVNTKLSGDGGTALKVQTFEEFKAKE